MSTPAIPPPPAGARSVPSLGPVAAGTSGDDKLAASLGVIAPRPDSVALAKQAERAAPSGVRFISEASEAPATSEQLLANGLAPRRASERSPASSQGLLDRVSTAATTTTTNSQPISEQPPSADYSSDEAVYLRTVRRRKLAQSMTTLPPYLKTRTGTMASSIFTLANTIIGGTTLILPWAAAQAGLYAFLVMLGVSLVAIELSLRLLFLAAQHGHHATYSDMARAVVHDMTGSAVSSARAGKAMKAIILLYSYFAVLSNLIFIADFLRSLALTWLAPSNPLRIRAVILALVGVLLFPLMLARTLSALRYTAFLAIVSVCFVVLCVVVRQNDMTPDLVAKRASSHFVGFGTGLGMIQALPIAVTAFACHVNYPTISSELRKPSPAKVHLFTDTALLISLIVYATICIAGYSTFYGSAAGNVLNSYANSDQLIQAARVLMTVMIMCAAPLNMAPAKMMLAKLMVDGGPLTALRIRLTGAIMFCTLVALAMIVSNVRLVMSLLGSIFVPLISFVLPATFFLYLVPRNAELEDKSLRLYRICARVMLITGVALMMLCTIVTFATTK